jgi:hypothetical protein
MISMESGGICMVNLVNTLLTLLTLSFTLVMLELLQREM